MQGIGGTQGWEMGPLAGHYGWEQKPGHEVKDPHLRAGKKLFMGDYFGEVVYLMKLCNPLYSSLVLFKTVKAFSRASAL